MIYLDNAAMEKPLDCVINAVVDAMRNNWMNPNGAYERAQSVRSLIEDSKKHVASLINADPSEIHFTSGATESANILMSSFMTNDDDVYITDIEHPAVENAVNGYIGILPVDKYGSIYPSELPFVSEFDRKTVLFVISANNEIGTIQPLKYIGNMCRNRDFYFATDLTQAFGHIPIDVKDMKIDFAFGSGQKIGGLSGCGFLYVRKDLEDRILPLCVGGLQDKYKGGTENITGIVALGEASLVAKEILPLNETVRQLRDYMIDRILKEVPDTILIGHPTERLPNNVNIGFGGLDSEAIVQYLDLNDICVSAGSACHSKSVEPSHVLKALRLPNRYINGSVRFTLSFANTKEEIDEVVETLKKCCTSMRSDKEI